MASLLTPVPGGVGPMTAALLLRNTLHLAQRSLGRRGFSTQRNTSFEFQLPTPSDIAISQSCEPLEISDIGQALGLKGAELVPWGFHRAKVDAAKVHARGDGGCVVCVVCGVWCVWCVWRVCGVCGVSVV